MNIYINNQVKQVRNLHQSILNKYLDFNLIKDFLDALSINLFEAFNKGEKTVTIEINNYHPLLIGCDYDEIHSRDFSLEDARLTLAREYGFQEWSSIDGTLNPDFETAIDLLLNGEENQLKQMIQTDPTLLSQRSPFGHRATLLHYAGSNGVEIWRQVVPVNLPEIVKMLIDSGADKNAKARFYGGEYSTLELASTSAHPKAAGIKQDLECILN
ncbi:hypothetical protein [Ekhidna sp.]|uniref:hypothetical protein n=1 Tax=Ekhidna sp. TaxID=2608089 RepID=UPI003B59F4AE